MSLEVQTPKIDINSIDFNELTKFFSDYINGMTHINNSSSLLFKETCRSCGGSDFVEDIKDGIIVCTNSACGQVLREVSDNGPEWKHYEHSDRDSARCTKEFDPLLPQSSLGTSIGGYGRCKLKMLHNWISMPYRERSLNNIFKKIHEVCQNANIVKCVEDDIKIMYKLVSDIKHVTGPQKGKYVITRGINRKGIIASCMFFACIRKGISRTAKEIGKMWGIKESDMNGGCKNLEKLLKMGKFEAKVNYLHSEISKPEHFIRRYCDALNIKTQYVGDALKIASNIDRLNISNHTPFSFAAASILLMAEINDLKYVTKKRVLKAFNISDNTMMKTYKELEPYKSVLIDNELVDDIVKNIKHDMSKQVLPPEVLKRMEMFGITEADMKAEFEEIKKIDMSFEYDELCTDSYDTDTKTETLENISDDIMADINKKFDSMNKIVEDMVNKIDHKKDIELFKSSGDLITSIKKDLELFGSFL